MSRYSSLNIVIAGVPYGCQRDCEDGRWVTTTEIDEIEDMAAGITVTHVSPSDIQAGWTPDGPVHVLLTETSGRERSWDSLLGILPGSLLEPLLKADLKWVQLCSAGVEHVRGVFPSHVAVTNASGVHSEAIAETVMGGILFHYKRFRERLANQATHRFEPLNCDELRGKTLCILGVGQIGQAVARKAAEFDMRIVGVRRTPGRSAGPFTDIHTVDQLPRALSEADILVVACPLTPETEGLIGADELNRLGSGYLVNVARGAIVEERALHYALTEGDLAGALLDAHVAEPLSADDPVWDIERVLVLPHDSHSSQYIGDNILSLFRKNLALLLSGKPLQNIVSFERGY